MATKQTIPAVELEHVSKHFGPVQAVKNVSLVIEPGEVIAFLGPNGAGKTTSISLMLGLRSPSSGSVALFGKDPRKAQNRKRVGAMLQDASVPWMLSVWELVELFARLHEQSMDTRKAIQMAGLEDKAHARVSTLSGGQQQRVYFAMALVGNPDILFLDEPTTGLDVESRRNFWDQINDQIKRGKTIILTTHNLEEADAIARRIVVIDRGEIIADGTPDDIKQHVGGKHVRFHAPALTLAELRALPGVQLAQELNGRFDLYTMQPENILATLFHNGTELRDLEVVGAGLEEAFLALTQANATRWALYERLKGLEESFLALTQAGNAQQEQAKSAPSEA